MLDAFKRSSASRVTAVLPYYGYARQDRKDKPRVPITAKLVADLLTAAGADRVLCVDLHAAQIQGFFDIPVDHLFAAPVLLDAIRDSKPRPADRRLARTPAASSGPAPSPSASASRLAIVDKRRKGKNEVEVMHVIGDVKDRNVIDRRRHHRHRRDAHQHGRSRSQGGRRRAASSRAASTPFSRVPRSTGSTAARSSTSSAPTRSRSTRSSPAARS